MLALKLQKVSSTLSIRCEGGDGGDDVAGLEPLSSSDNMGTNGFCSEWKRNGATADIQWVEEDIKRGIIQEELASCERSLWRSMHGEKPAEATEMPAAHCAGTGRVQASRPW